MEKFDLIIIGGGAGAFAAAIKANELGAKTVIVNSGLPLGGTCVNVGCVPSKTLLHAGEVLHQAKHHGISGIEIEVKSFDFQKVIGDELSLVEKLRQEKYEKVLQNLEQVTFVEGKARFISSDEVEVNGQTLSADKFIIATGSTANVPPIKGIRDVGYITHVEALKLKQQPRELIVIGAGPLGLEFAQMFARLGTKVTILQRAERIFPPAEKVLADQLTQMLEGEGIAINLKVATKNVRLENGKKIVRYSVDGQEQEVRGEEILLAAGKTPNTAYLNLDEVGVETNERKAVVVKENLQTSTKHIYAVGDVNDRPLRLETTAGREGTLAAENALKGTQKSVDYNSVPYTIFTDPQLASVGLTDEQALKLGIKCSCRVISFAMVPKAHIVRRTEGLIKMVINAETKQILGVHILAPSAGNLIAEAALLVKHKLTTADVLDSLPVFPTLSEAIKIVAQSFTKDISKLSCCV